MALIVLIARRTHLAFGKRRVAFQNYLVFATELEQILLVQHRVELDLIN